MKPSPFAVSTLGLLLLLSACSSGGGDPFASGTGGRINVNIDAGGGGSPGTGGAAPTAGTGGASGTSTPKPARMIVLGDSIVACSNVGGPMGADCSIKKLFDYVKATYAPDLTYENDAAPGAVSDDVPSKQLGTVTTGPGHALVVVYIGGNNLAKYLFASDMAAMSRTSS